MNKLGNGENNKKLNKENGERKRKLSTEVSSSSPIKSIKRLRTMSSLSGNDSDISWLFLKSGRLLYNIAMLASLHKNGENSSFTGVDIYRFLIIIIRILMIINRIKYKDTARHKTNANYDILVSLSERPLFFYVYLFLFQFSNLLIKSSLGTIIVLYII